MKYKTLKVSLSTYGEVRTAAAVRKVSMRRMTDILIYRGLQDVRSTYRILGESYRKAHDAQPRQPEPEPEHTGFAVYGEPLIRRLAARLRAAVHRLRADC